MMHLSKILAERRISAVLLFLLAIAVFSPSMKSDFVWDDYESIQNRHMSLSPGDIYYHIVPPVNKSKKARYYRPVVYFSFAADMAIWGDGPEGFHISNIIFFSVSVVLFYFMSLYILRNLGSCREPEIAFVAALLFVFHPMHVESVSWIAGRTDVLCGLFLFLAVICHIASYNKIWVSALSIAAFTLSLLSKEVAIVFPVLVIAYDLYAGNFLRRSSIIKYLLYIGILALYLYLRGRAFVYMPELSQEVASGSASAVLTAGNRASMLPEIINAFRIMAGSYFLYIQKLLLPYGFNAFITGVSTDAYYFVSSILFLVLLAVAAVVSTIRKSYVVPYSIIWVLVTLGPSVLVSVFTIASTPVAERYLFIPSAGYCILAGYVLISGMHTGRFRLAVIIAASILILIYAVLNIQRQNVWSSDFNLWKDTVKKSPYHPVPHSNYGLALSRIGEHEEAIREFRTALLPELHDTPRGKAQTANNIGLIYMENQDFDTAEQWFDKALEYNAGYGRTYYHLGLINFAKGETTGSRDSYIRALGYLNKTLEYYHGYAKAHLLMADTYLRLGEPQRAVEQAKLAIESGIKGELRKEAMEIIKIYDKPGKEKPGEDANKK